MKQLIFILLLQFLIVPSSFSQFGIGKVKSQIKTDKKKKDKKNEESTQQEAKKETSTETTSEEEKREEIYKNSPARGAIWDFNDLMKGIEESPGGNYAEHNLENAKKKLEVIKQRDPDYPYFSELEERQKKGAELVKAAQEKNKIRSQYSHKLDLWQRQLWDLKSEPWKYDKVLNELTEEKFNELVNEIENSDVHNDRLKEKIEKIKTYKSELLNGKVKGAVIKDNEEAYRKAVMWTAEYRKNPDFEKYLEFNRKVDPEIKGLEKQIKWTKELIELGVEDPELSNFLPKAENRLKEITNYRDSGELEKLQDKLRYEAMDEIRVGKNAKTESAVTALVNKHFDTEEFGKPLRIVTVGNWSVSKNGLDIPTHKRKTVHIVYKDKQERCFLYDTEVQKDYEGGGAYGPMYLDDAYGLTEMLCKNAFK